MFSYMKDSHADYKKILYLESYTDFLEYTLKSILPGRRQQAYLLYTDFNLKTNLVSLKNKKTSTTFNLSAEFSFSQNIEINNASVEVVFNEDLQSAWSVVYCDLLKDLLKRPVLPLVIVPFFSQSCVLCIEDFDGLLSQDKIKNYFIRNYDMFSVSLLQIQEQNKMNFFSFLWEQAFEKNMDPMSIENKATVFTKKNEAFSKSLLKNHSATAASAVGPEGLIVENGKNLSAIHLADSIYEPIYYDIKTGDNDLVRFCHYKDMSKILFLREDLLQRKKMEALGGLADQLSNQLNNPLAGIRALVQILQNSIQKNKEVLNNLKDVESETWRCRSIIENLKNFSNKNNSIEVFDLNKLVLDVIALSRIALSKSKYTLALDKDSLMVKGSKQLIQQVVFNVIINAIQAISFGDQIILKSYKSSQWVILEIKDYGKGMSKDVQEKIFTPFFTTKKNEGTGLGLSMSLNIMKKFEGRIGVSSVEGEYTLFALSFPLVRE